MKHLTALFITIGTITSISVMHYEARLNLVERTERGTIRADVESMQSRYITVDGKEQKAIDAFNRRVEANMKAIRSHVAVVGCYQFLYNGAIKDTCLSRAEY